MISVEQAIEKLQSHARPVCDKELVGIDQALGRTLSASVIAPINVPPADNSAMDGFAVRTNEIALKTQYRISQRIPAGIAPDPLQENSVAHIFTGANIPAGVDAVIAQEDSISQNDQVQFNSLAVSGENIRQCGQDVRKGSEILPAGKVLRPQEIGLIASCGIAEVEVYKKLRIAILSTGDELVEPGQKAMTNQIYNSNRFLLKGFCQACGFETIDFASVTDNLDQTISALDKAASQADVILTTGGVSVGEEDHIKPALEQIGSLDMWKVAIKPGKPIALGKIRDADLIGLPGNPSSVFTTFLILALPRLRLLQGRSGTEVTPEMLPANFSRSAGSRQEYLRARKTSLGVEIFPNQSSGLLSSACWGDGFALQPQDTAIESGQLVEFIDYHRLMQR